MRSDRQSAQLGDAALTMMPAAGIPPWGWLRTQVTILGSIVAEWRRRHRSRRELRALSAYQVRDFCLDPMAAERETRKPFWRE